MENLGGRVTSTMSKNTEFVVIGDVAIFKAYEAKAFGVTILSYEEFVEIVDNSE